MRIVYVKPACEAVLIEPHSYVLMNSNEDYPVDPFDPSFSDNE